MSKLYLIGDGILNNNKYLDEKENTLSKLLAKNFDSVISLCHEDLRVSNIYNGVVGESGSTFFPLSFIPSDTFQSVYNIKQNKDHIVLSLGGNDLNDHIFKIILGAEIFVNSIINPKFKKIYNDLISDLKIISDKIIILSLYLPYMGKDSSFYKYKNISNPVIDRWNGFLSKLAKEQNISLIDINMSVDNTDRANYSKINETRLNNKPTESISMLIENITNNWKGYGIYHIDKNNRIVINNKI